MSSRLISGLTTAAIVGVFLFVPSSVFAGNAADAMKKLKEQSEIKAKSAERAAKSESASADAKAKAKKAVKEMLEKDKK